MAIRYEWHEGGMNMSLEGDWVAHADYSTERADAQAEIERLRGALETIVRSHHDPATLDLPPHLIAQYALR